MGRMAEVEIQENSVSLNPIVDPEIEAMMKAGVHMGHAKGKNHSAMQPYIFGVRNTVSIIDLTKTKEKLAVALEVLKGVASLGEQIILVGTRPAARRAILEIVERVKMPYYVDRWIGGTLTNLEEIARRSAYLAQLEKEKGSGGWEKYTKKEQLERGKELERLKKNFEGIRSMKRLPGVVFVVDINEDITAVREGRRKKIPVVALVDTNSDANKVDYPIPSNDDALPAVRYMMGRVADAIEDGQKQAKEKAALIAEKIEEKKEVGLSA